MLATSIPPAGVRAPAHRAPEALPWAPADEARAPRIARPALPRLVPPSRAFDRLLAGFDPITLSQAKEVALLRRVDTKYVLSAGQLFSILDALAEDYRVLDVEGVRLQHYRTLYFDTPTLDLYLSHHRGHANRYKVRSRVYVDSGVSFLEIKRKDNKNWTTKSRTQTEGLVTQLTPDLAPFLREHCPFAGQALTPALSNEFHRITLVGKRYPERLTLDLNLAFGRDHAAVLLPGLAIAEVKQAGINRSSDFVRAMRAWGIRPTGISKYCVGVALLCQTVKHNSFRPKLRLIERITGGTHVWRDS